ncbi:hypothetical protein SAY86_031379 [Trapa natans]|uniref:LSM domain-containing protein n=1 Tax=Trapa natans TaxID=22666 RepID=A0AAN7R881_TRANT|nr:hypothetical protein SAY86_031379 [Trapa natans]
MPINLVVSLPPPSISTDVSRLRFQLFGHVDLRTILILRLGIGLVWPPVKGRLVPGKVPAVSSQNVSSCPMNFENSSLNSEDILLPVKFFSWVQSKINGKEGNGQLSPGVSSSNYHHARHESREEFSDWPNGLLAIGTFGSSDLKGTLIQETQQPVEDPSSSPDLSDFTQEEVGKLQKELTKLLTRKSSSKTDKEPTDLPLDRFLNCPSSLEVDRRISSSVSTDLDDRDEEIERTISVIIRKCKEICKDNRKKAIGKKSLSFLLKKMFVCQSGFAASPSLRDTLPESRMEKLLRTLLHKKIYQRSSPWPSSGKKYIEDGPALKAEEDINEKKEKICDDGSKWVRTDSESNAVIEGACERVIVGGSYCDIPLGLYVIRGENVVLIGELDVEKEELPPHMMQVSVAEIKRAQKAEREATDLKGSMRKRMEFLDFD